MQFACDPPWVGWIAWDLSRRNSISAATATTQDERSTGARRRFDVAQAAHSRVRPVLHHVAEEHVREVRLEPRNLDAEAVQEADFDGVAFLVAASREFLARCTTEKALNSNPKCKIETHASMEDIPAIVEVDYLNGNKETIRCEGKTAQQIMESIQFKSEQMEKNEMLKLSGLDKYKFEAEMDRKKHRFEPIEKQK